MACTIVSADVVPRNRIRPLAIDHDVVDAYN